MPQAKFPFGKDFQVKLLSMFYNDFQFLLFAHDVVQPSYFTSPSLAWFYATIRDYFLDYRTKIGSPELKQEMRKAVKAKRIKSQEISSYVELFKQIVPPVQGGKEYVTKEVIDFCKHQAIKAAAIETADYLSKQDFDAIADSWTSALQVGTNTVDIGSHYFEEWPERIRRRSERLEERSIPTGITMLDILIGGGLKPGQLGLWMAPTGRGKSVGLVHCGKRAVIMKKRVIHYTLELGQDDVMERYDASFSQIPMRLLAEKDYLLAPKLEKLGKRFGDMLLVKYWPTKSASVNTIRAHLKQCEAIGFIPDLILLDYIDLLKPVRHRKEKREELTESTEEFRGLLGELQVPGWSATQSRRAAISKEEHDEEDVSEDIGKMNTSDIVITLNQNKQERSVGTMRLLAAKNRNGPAGAKVEIETDLERMIFYRPPRGDERTTRQSNLTEEKKVKKTPPPKKIKKKPPPARKTQCSIQ